MTRFGQVMAVLMIICLSFYVLWFFDVLPKEKIEELASQAMEKLIQLVSWLQVKAHSLWKIVSNKFFSSTLEDNTRLLPLTTRLNLLSQALVDIEF